MDKEIVIKNKTGLHARPAAQFVALAKKYPDKIMVYKGEKSASATSLLSLLGLGITLGDTIHLQAAGDQAEQVLTEMAEFLEKLAYEE